MLESIVNSGIIYYIIGGVAIGGVFSKMVVSISLSRLVKAASNMSKSSHGFMRLVRAKFEHAHMVNDRVENIEVFVEKYVQEYKVMGVCLYTWQWLEKMLATVVGALILLALGMTYYDQGMSDAWIESFGLGGAIFVGLMVFYQLGNEKFKLQKMRVYMVDYLENVCGLRYARGMDKEKIIIPAQNLGEERLDGHGESVKDFSEKLEEQMANIELKKHKRRRDMKKSGAEAEISPGEQVYTAESQSPMSIKDISDKALEDPRVTLTMVEKLLLEEADRRDEMKKRRGEEQMPNESTIREILQEFMA